MELEICARCGRVLGKGEGKPLVDENGAMTDDLFCQDCEDKGYESYEDYLVGEAEDNAVDYEMDRLSEDRVSFVEQINPAELDLGGSLRVGGDQ